MRIMSVRRGFTSDHSSTSYEFAAIDKPLDTAAQNKVASLSSRADPNKRTVEFIYNVEGYDIPGGWETLMCNYYDVMHSNDYDWVNLAVAFNASEEQQDEIAKYEFDGGDNLGVSVSSFDSRIVVAIHCQLDPGAEYGLTRSRRKGPSESESYEPRDPLLNLLGQVRKQLIDGDYRTIYAVWEKYGWEDDLEADDGEEFEKPPVPPEMPIGADVVERLRDLLTTP